MTSVILIGKLENKPHLLESNTKEKYYSFTLRVERNFREENGELKSDLYDCRIWKGLAETLSDPSHQQDVLAVRGRLAPLMIQNSETKQTHGCVVIAEKISYYKP